MTPPVESVLDAVWALRRGATSAEALVEVAIERHTAIGGRLNAWKYFDADGARVAAREADRRLKQGDAPALCGIPVSVKDLYGVRGMPTFAGSARQLPEGPWSREGWLITRLREAGAVLMGKTHTVEFAYGGVGMNPHWGTPRNPWDADTARIPGGSSCGAGISLWEGSALLALGSDTGGSIRIPAAFTGVVGHKTTKGRWPTDGVVQLSTTFDTVGALTRDVRDSICFFGSVDPKWGDPALLLETLEASSVEGLRIATPDCAVWADCQPDIAAVVTSTLDELRGHGAHVISVDGKLVDDAVDLYMTGGIGKAEVHEFLTRDLPDWPAILHPTVGSRLAHPEALDGDTYRETMAHQRRLAAFAPALFGDADVLVLPTNIITAPPLSEVDDDLGRYGVVNYATLRPTCAANLLELCAVSMPVGRDDAGMPVGMQIIARGGEDESLLGVARSIERALGGSEARIGTPPLLQRMTGSRGTTG